MKWGEVSIRWLKFPLASPPAASRRLTFRTRPSGRLKFQDVACGRVKSFCYVTHSFSLLTWMVVCVCVFVLKYLRNIQRIAVYREKFWQCLTALETTYINQEDEAYLIQCIRSERSFQYSALLSTLQSLVRYLYIVQSARHRALMCRPLLTVRQYA